MGEITEISAKRQIHVSKWNAQGQKLIGNTDEVKSFNLYLKTLEQKVYEAYHELLREKVSVTSELLKNKQLGVEDRKRLLLEIMQGHNSRMEQLVRKEYARGILTRYKSCYTHLYDFLKWKYKISDILILAKLTWNSSMTLNST